MRLFRKVKTTISPLKIDKNIPAPAPRAWGKTKYPFKHMKVGDSFLATKETDKRSRSRIEAACRFFSQRQNPRWKFAIRKTEEGLRAWRIE